MLSCKIAEQGVYVLLKEIIRGFQAIVDGKMDQYPEAAFYNVGNH